jgi:hypothetical protein
MIKNLGIYKYVLRAMRLIFSLNKGFISEKVKDILK